MRCTKKKKRNHYQETKQSTEPDFDMVQMLKLSDRKFITMISMLKAQVEKVDSMYDLMIISKERRKV